MMNQTNNTLKSWIDLGYGLFSEEGHEGLQVERLARILGRNKSGFYHYFGDKEVYLQQLMALHLKKEEALISEVINLTDFNPGFLKIMVENKETILFQTHLVKNRELKLFRDTYLEVNQMVEKFVIPIWVDYLGTSPSVAQKYWKVIRDSFYSRVSAKSFNQQWLSEFVEEAKAILNEARNESTK